MRRHRFSPRTGTHRLPHLQPDIIGNESHRSISHRGIHAARVGTSRGRPRVRGGLIWLAHRCRVVCSVLFRGVRAGHTSPTRRGHASLLRKCCQSNCGFGSLARQLTAPCGGDRSTVASDAASPRIRRNWRGSRVTPPRCGLGGPTRNRSAAAAFF